MSKADVIRARLFEIIKEDEDHKVTTRGVNKVVDIINKTEDIRRYCTENVTEGIVFEEVKRMIKQYYPRARHGVNEIGDGVNKWLDLYYTGA